MLILRSLDSRLVCTKPGETLTDRTLGIESFGMLWQLSAVMFRDHLAAVSLLDDGRTALWVHVPTLNGWAVCQHGIVGRAVVVVVMLFLSLSLVFHHCGHHLQNVVATDSMNILRIQPGQIAEVQVPVPR